MTGRMGRGSTYQGRDDIMLVFFEDRAAVAGVFTKSSLPAWPVQWSKRQLKAGKGEAKILLVNAGSANALSGPEGSARSSMSRRAAPLTRAAKGRMSFWRPQES